MENNKSQNTFIGGKLKLKNIKNDKTLTQMKKIISKDIPKLQKQEPLIQNSEEYLHILENQINEPSYLDTRTQAQKMFDERRLKKLPEKIKKNLNVTFKQRFETFNKALSKLPEHYDIPKVGPG